MSARKALTFVEIDIDYCSRTYGVGACTATMGGSSPTGDRKCFNTLATCQARAAFNNQPVTLRFARGTAYLAESGVEALPVIENESFMPATVSLGENLGTRASLTVTFSDFPWPDTGPGFDKYVSERPYDPFKLGTFWGKFRARQPYLRGRSIRLIHGYLGQTLEEMETRHFIIEGFEGPSLDGRYTVTAKDALKLADDDRAQAPKPSNGYLLSDIAAGATSATLGPTGIGNIEYPSSGHLNIGGKEIVAFTRSGDNLTLTRARYNTVAVAHKAQDRAQVCLEFVGKDAAVILQTLFTGYASMPANYIPINDWSDETETFLGVLYSRLIPEPTGVSKLASELVQQAGLAVWWDDIGREMRLRVLRPITEDAALFDDTSILSKSLRIKDQPEKRLSQVWVYYGQINPLLRTDEPTNFRSMHLAPDLNAEANYGQPAVKKIYGAWIPEFGRVVAQRAGDIQLGQNVNAPRQMTFETMRDEGPRPRAGLGCNVSSRPLQTDTGARDIVPFMITRLSAGAAGYEVVGQEARFKQFAPDLGDRTIVISTDIASIDLRAIYDRQFPTPTVDDEIIFIISSGVVVSSTGLDIPALNSGNWPSGVVPLIRLRGRIHGAGGDAGNGGATERGTNGRPGGTALRARSPIRIEASPGSRIWSGGGGGGGGAGRSGSGGGGGGGGAGVVPGSGGSPARGDGGRGNPGTATSGGTGGVGPYPGQRDQGRGGRGGDPGQPGSRGYQSYSRTNYGQGGDAGRAIDGNSFVDITGSVDIRGPRVN